MPQNQNILFVVGGFALSIFLVVTSCLFTVDQMQQAIVLQFGEAQRVYTEPGLKFKIPMIQDVIILEKRVIDFDLPPVYITTGDQKRLVVNVYARFRVEDPLQFYRTIKPTNETGAKARLETLISSSVRNVLGKVPLRSVLSAERSTIMSQIEGDVKIQAKPLGIDMVDVRIIRTELPIENRDAVFARMNAELDRFAMENRAKGSEVAQTIRAQADKECTIIIAQAQKTANESRGKGESEAIRITTDAFGRDVEFYNYYRSLENYREAFGSSDTNFVISCDSQFMQSLFEPLSKTRS
jgi:membrane protease subunit HflC